MYEPKSQSSPIPHMSLPQGSHLTTIFTSHELSCLPWATKAQPLLLEAFQGQITFPFNCGGLPSLGRSDAFYEAIFRRFRRRWRFKATHGGTDEATTYGTVISTPSTQRPSLRIIFYSTHRQYQDPSSGPRCRRNSIFTFISISNPPTHGSSLHPIAEEYMPTSHR